MGSAVYGEKELRGGQQNERNRTRGRVCGSCYHSKNAVVRVEEASTSEKAAEGDGLEVKALAGEDPTC